MQKNCYHKFETFFANTLIQKKNRKKKQCFFVYLRGERDGNTPQSSSKTNERFAYLNLRLELNDPEIIKSDDDDEEDDDSDD